MLFLSLHLGSNAIAFGQVVYDFKSAQAIALADDKFIILDFQADWCGPCKRMDKELWASAEFKKLLNRFVLLKIDVDREGNLAQQYGVRTIPKVVILSANEDELYSKTGYLGSAGYLKLFKNFPTEIKRLNAIMSGVIERKEITPQESFALGYEYGKVGRAINDDVVKSIFLGMSNSYLKECEKQTTSEKMKRMSTLNHLLNNAYLGNYNKVLKKAKKLNYEDEELLHFILAYCHQKKGNVEEYERYKGKIKSKRLMRELEEDVDRV